MSVTPKAMLMSKPHGNTGKQHALIGLKPLDARVAFRLPCEVKAAAERNAAAAGVSASQWYLAVIRAAL